MNAPAPVPLAPGPTLTAPASAARWRITVAQMYEMLEAGILHEDDPVELIGGELIVMSPQGPRHTVIVMRFRNALERAYGDGVSVRTDMPLDASEHSQPEPDVAVANRPLDDWSERHPRGDDCHLVVEIALITQEIDKAKANLYASAGVPVYWLVDLRERTVAVYELPGDGRYHRVTTFADDQDLAVPDTDARLSIAALLR